jgi:hypothetical protein
MLFHRCVATASGYYGGDECVTRGGRGSFPDFVRRQGNATAAVASMEDAAECGKERTH